MPPDVDYDLHWFADAVVDQARLDASLAEQEVLRQAGDRIRLALDRRWDEIQRERDMRMAVEHAQTGRDNYRLLTAIAAE